VCGGGFPPLFLAFSQSYGMIRKIHKENEYVLFALGSTQQHLDLGDHAAELRKGYGKQYDA
jgi:hypothetical protein